LPRCVHPRSIKHSSTCSHEPIFKVRFELRCFQFLSNYGVATRLCLVRQPAHKRPRKHVPFVLVLPSPQAQAPPTDIDQTVSRRSELN